jgi:uncharacterized protein
MHRPVEFASEGVALRGRLYGWPEARRPRPLVVMAHGFSATISGMVADRFADVFHASGFSVLLYDHGGFGLSDGLPRCEIDPFRQAREYRHAVDFALTLPEVDSERVALWGDSLSAAAAIAAAAADARVAALIAQVPACGSTSPPPDADGALFEAACRPFLDRCAAGGYAVTRRGPMPVVSCDQAGAPSLLAPITAYRWFIEYGGRHGTGWENRASVLVAERPASWQPALCAGRVQAPSLFLIAPDDEMPGADPRVAMEAFGRVPAAKELLEIGGGHFGLLHHPGELFDVASAAQARFLVRQLG